MKRRQWLQTCMMPGVARLLAPAAGMLPGLALAEEFDPFQAASVDAVMQALNLTPVVPSQGIQIEAPKIAENGASVSIRIVSEIPNTSEIIMIVSGNPKPLAARHRFGSKALAAVSSRVRMRETSDVIAVVAADGRHYSAKRQVKVTLGGCGG